MTFVAIDLDSWDLLIPPVQKWADPRKKELEFSDLDPNLSQSERAISRSCVKPPRSLRK